MVELFANSRDPDQMPLSVASDLGLRCLHFKGSPDYNRLSVMFVNFSNRGNTIDNSKE